MSKFVSNYPISRRLFVAFALAAILPSVIIAIMGIYNVGQLNSQGTAANVMTAAQASTHGISGTLQDMYAQTRTLESGVLAALLTHEGDLPSVSTGTGTVHRDVQQFTNDLLTYQDKYDPTSSQFMQPVIARLNDVAPADQTANTESHLLHTVATDSWPKYNQAQQNELQYLQQVLGRVAAGSVTPFEAATRITGYSATLDSTYANLNSNWQQMSNYVNVIAGLCQATSAGQMQSVIVSTILAFIFSIAIVLICGVVVRRSIVNPLAELVSLTRRISKGETTARALVTGRDEISIVANSMNSMLDNIVHLIEGTQSQRDVLQGQVEKLVSEVSGVGEGDLRVQAEVTTDALGVLADSFNYMVEELGSLVVRVKKVAHDVQESTSLASDRMNELVEIADRQIQQIASAAVEIESMAQVGQQVANRALALAGTAREARISAQGGRQAVQQTVAGMGRIQANVQETSNRVQTLGERSREINNIVEAISTIAHQTNRLALDAAIQAAMAGENGKGFGAVAADIRRLAERAKEQAGSVGQIIRSVRDDIGAVAVSMRDTERETAAGAKMAEEAGTSLVSIFSVIERQAHEIDVISQMTMQQQQSSGEVVRIMQIVSDSTQESSASTHDAAQNMERVAHLAEQLRASVEAFKLRESLNYFVPNESSSETPGKEQDSQFSLDNAFRAVASAAQSFGLPGLAPGNSTPVPAIGSGNQPLQYSPVLSKQDNSHGQQFLMKPSPFEHGSGQPHTPSGGTNAGEASQWPSPYNWQPDDWNQADWQQ